MALLVRTLVMGALLAVGTRGTLWAQEMEVPVAMQLPLFLKVMSFDRQLHARTAGELVIAFAYQGGFRASVETKEQAWRSTIGVHEFDGMPVTLVAIDLDKEGLAAALSRSKATLLYIAPMRGVDMKELMAVTRAARVTTLTGVVRYVELGCAVGVRLRGDRPRILVNLVAARLEGAEFAAELLSLAEVL
ncbi:MAG: YfiR family protein [bacterium]